MICLDPGFKKRSSKEEFREHGKLNYRFYIRKILTLILMLSFLSVVKSLQLDSGTALVLGTVKDHSVIHFLSNGLGVHMLRVNTVGGPGEGCYLSFSTFKFSVGLQIYRIKS